MQWLRRSSDTSLRIGTERSSYLGHIRNVENGPAVPTFTPRYERVVCVRLGRRAIDHADLSQLQSHDKARGYSFQHIRVAREFGHRLLAAFRDNTSDSSPERQYRLGRNCHTFAQEVILGRSDIDDTQAEQLAMEIVGGGIDVTDWSSDQLRQLSQGAQIVFAQEAPSGNESGAQAEVLHSAVILGPNAEVVSLRRAWSTAIAYGSVAQTRADYAVVNDISLDQIRVFAPLTALAISVD